MKRIGSGILALFLCLFFGVTALAAKDEHVALPDDAGEVRSLAAWENILYLLTESAVYSWKTGQAEPSLLGALPSGDEQETESVHFAVSTGNGIISGAPSWLDFLLIRDGVLYGLDTGKGELYRLEAENGSMKTTLETTFDWSGMANTQSGVSIPRQVSSVVFEDGYLYCLKSNDDFINQTLTRFDLSTGKSLDYDLKYAVGFTPYKEGQALILQYENQEAVYAGSGKLWLNVLDLNTGSVQKGLQLPVGSATGLCYDEASDTACMFSGGEINAVQSLKDPRLAAYAPVGSSGTGGAALLPGGLYALGGDGVYLQDINPNGTIPRALRIQGGRENSYLTFQEDHPDIPVVLGNAGFSDVQMLMQDMASGGSDLYCVSPSSLDIESLMKKGYTAALSESSSLSSLAKEMYPFLQSVMYLDGELMAFPVSINAHTLGYSKKALEELGLTKEDLPKTYLELMDFISRWEDDYGTDHPTLSLFDQEFTESPKETFLSYIVEAYHTSYTARGETLTFDTPLFDALLNAVEKADFSALVVKDVQEAAAGAMVTYRVTLGGAGESPATALFTQYQQATLNQFGSRFSEFSPLVLSLSEEQEPVISAMAEVYIVNPYSQNKDLALLYLEHYAAALEGVSLINLMSGQKEPILDPNYESALHDLEKEKADLEQQFSTAKEDEKKALQEAIDGVNERISFRETLKWRISEGDIAAYQARAAYIQVQKVSPLAAAQQDMGIATLFSRYLAGQATRAQFIGELEQKLRMIRMEGE